MSVITDNKAIGEGLKEAHAAWARENGHRPRSIRLPAPTQIQFHKSGPDFHITMSAKAVCSNMQTNAAGFEGWALSLRLWLNVRSVTLHWERPTTHSQSESRHYARFLYRAQRFAALFPDWFSIGTADHLEECPIRAGHDLYLNVPGTTSKEPAEPKRETMIERALVGQHAETMKGAFGLSKIDRQFPVGLYRTEDLKGPVFTGGTSAIDIVGTDGPQLMVIELKAGMNIMVGALGEMLFYASVLRDAAGSRFKFGGRVSDASRSCIGPEDVKQAKAIRAILLAEEYHPLLEHPDLMQTLNAAASKQSDPVDLRFEQWRLSDFSELAPLKLTRVA